MLINFVSFYSNKNVRVFVVIVKRIEKAIGFKINLHLFKKFESLTKMFTKRKHNLSILLR